MRVLITREPGEALVGYLNVGAVGFPDEPGLESHIVPSLLELGEAVLPGEADEVYVPSVVDFVPTDELERHLAHWGSRLSTTGRLVVRGLDLLALAHVVANEGWRYDLARQTLYANGRKAAYAAEEMRGAVSSVGLVVDQVDQDHLGYTIVASRPKENG